MTTMDGLYNQVKSSAASLILLKATEHILFLTGIFVPSISLKDIIAHKETLTKFTQQALNDS